MIMKVNSYDLDNIEDSELKFAVIVAKHSGKWIFVRHKERTTWEIPGGHKEEQEDINNTALRELVEETGAKEFKLYSVCTYSVDRDGIESFGKLFYAEVETLGKLPNLEIGEVRLFDEIPVNQTYPLIQPFIFERISKFLGDTMHKK
ncbi:NUDIX domain-containing protein [Microbacteriaceae bacterium 4G12]